MVWGVRSFSFHYFFKLTVLSKWFVASIFILFVGMSMGELASAAPTSGGVRLVLVYCAYSFADRLAAILLDTFALVCSVSQHPCLDRWLYVGHTPGHLNTTLIILRQTQIPSVLLPPLRPSTGAVLYRLWQPLG